jgi:hypothetical protein
MKLSRRAFVTTVGRSLASHRDHRRRPRGSTQSYNDWPAVRARFDLTSGWLHCLQFYLVAHARPVRESIERCRRLLDANPFITVERGMRFDQQAQQEIFPGRVQQAAADYLWRAAG